MAQTSSTTALRSIMYGGAAVLLILEVFHLARAALTNSYVPIVPILAGIFTAAGLLFIVYAEHSARQADKRDHRRISRVAHQLESPLQALQDDLAALLKSGPKLPAEHRLKLKHMATKTTVLLENVRDVFLMLQGQEKPLGHEPRIYNLCALLEDVVAKQQPVASARNVELVYKAHCQDALVRVDRQLLLIALNHLVDNALTYTLTPGQVNIAIVRGDKVVRVVVQDRGIGVSDKDRAIIFQPFARGEKAEGYDPDGIGVGLTLAQLIVAEAGGKLRWRNRAKGMGAQFEVVLPLAKTGKG